MNGKDKALFQILHSFFIDTNTSDVSMYLPNPLTSFVSFIKQSVVAGMELVSVIHYAETLNNRQCQSSDSKTIFRCEQINDGI